MCIAGRLGLSRMRAADGNSARRLGGRLACVSRRRLEAVVELAQNGTLVLRVLLRRPVGERRVAVDEVVGRDEFELVILRREQRARRRARGAELSRRRRAAPEVARGGRRALVELEELRGFGGRERR